MNVPPETLLTVGGMIVSVAVGWGAAMANTRGHAAQLKSLWDWKEIHERDSNTIRANEDVLRRLDNIDESIKTLADRRYKQT